MWASNASLHQRWPADSWTASERWSTVGQGRWPFPYTLWETPGVQLQAPHYSRDRDILQQLKQRATKMVRDWSTRHKRRASWDCSAWRREGSAESDLYVYKYLKRRTGKMEHPVVPSDRTGGNRHKFKSRKFHLNMIKTFLL